MTSGSRVNDRESVLREASAAVVALLPFVALALGLSVIQPETRQQILVSDPIVQAFDAWIGRLAIPALCAAIGAAWWTFFPPDRASLRHAAKQALAGISLVATFAPLLRVLVGPHLPPFIPPEESSRPGMLLGINAGTIEEALFRLGTLPVLLALLSDRSARHATIVTSVLLTGLAFTLAHEVGPGAAHFQAGFFVVRLGFAAVTSLLAIRFGFALVIAGHCTMHVAIPLLFT